MKMKMKNCVWIMMLLAVCWCDNDCDVYMDSVCTCELTDNGINIQCLYESDNVSSPLLLNSTTNQTININNLSLQSNNLSYLPDNYFQYIDSINFLGIHNNSFTQIPNAVTTVYIITSLDFSYNQLNQLNITTFGNNMYANYSFAYNQLENIYIRFNKTQFKSLNISNNRLKNVPNDLWLVSKSLDLSNNLLEILPVLPESQLEQLFLDYNLLQGLSPGSFINVPQLRQLHLCHNEISNVFSEIFSGLSLLTVLHMCNNNLSMVNANVFQHLNGLTELNLSNNEIRTISSESFHGLGNTLRILNLSNNNLSSIPDDSFTNLDNLRSLDLAFNVDLEDINHLILPPHLKSLILKNCSLHTIMGCGFLKLKDIQDLDLSGNAFMCSCRLSLLHNWYRARERTDHSDNKWKCRDSPDDELSTVSANVTNCGEYLEIMDQCKIDDGYAILNDTNEIKVQLELTSINSRVQANWVVEGFLDDVFGFVVLFKNDGEVIYKTPILEKTQNTFTVSESMEESTYNVCVNVMANTTFVLDADCESMSNISLDYVIGILAGVVFLIPCIAALVYIIRKDKMIKKLEYAPLPVGVPIVKGKGLGDIQTSPVIIIPGDSEQVYSSDIDVAICPYHENKAFDEQLSDDMSPCSSDVESGVVVTVTPPPQVRSVASMSEDTHL